MLTHRLHRLPAIILTVWLALAHAPAEAHAIIVAATPAVGTVVPGPTVPIELRFNSRIDPKRSRLSLVRPDGSAMPLPLAADGPPDMLRATADGLGPGHYRLRWQVLGLDGHITRGDIPFDVRG